MAYTVQNLIMDILPRIGRIENRFGITIWNAANSVQSMIYKKLLQRHSELLATGELFLVIPAYDYRANLPTDFLSLAEKPRSVSASDWLQSTAWMIGTVTSYTAATKTLVVNVTASNGSGTLAEWNIAVGVRPGMPIYTLDTSTSSVLVGIGSKTFITEDTLTLIPGQNIVISNEELPSDSSVISGLSPEYLDEDTHEESWWWDREYRYYGETYETASIQPRKFKILGTYFFIRPKVSSPVIISGTYNAKPATLTLVTNELPWNGFFDEIFREGCIRIMQKGIAIPEVDPDFAAFLFREFDQIINSRASLIGTQRMKHSDFM